ncbi:MAG: glutathione S-transferase family protein [Sphingomicrobium sp.]
MILYGSTMSPFVRKVAAYCAEKGVAVDIRPVGFRDPDPNFRRASPFGKMPAMLDDDYALADSSAIIHYLEAKYPEPALIPLDPRGRGRAVWFDEWADTMFVACGAKMFFNRVVAPRFLGRDGDFEVTDAAERDELPPLLEYLEREIPSSGFLVEDRLTIADLAVASPMVNLGHMDIALDPWPRVKAYAEGILARPSFAATVAKERAALRATA